MHVSVLEHALDTVPSVLTASSFAGSSSRLWLDIYASGCCKLKCQRTKEIKLTGLSSGWHGIYFSHKFSRKRAPAKDSLADVCIRLGKEFRMRAFNYGVNILGSFNFGVIVQPLPVNTRIKFSARRNWISFE